MVAPGDCSWASCLDVCCSQAAGLPGGSAVLTPSYRWRNQGPEAGPGLTQSLEELIPWSADAVLPAPSLPPALPGDREPLSLQVF